jgi:hypothetical protein
MKVRIRQLKNGKWVGEVHGLFRWRGIDAQQYGLGDAHIPGSQRYTRCWCDTEEQVETVIRNYVSFYGVGR